MSDIITRDVLPIKKEIKFGIELEFANPSYLLMREKVNEFNFHTRYPWYTTTDGSVTDVHTKEGGEIKSTILRNDVGSWESVRNVCDTAIKLGAKTSENTGLHMHFSYDIFEHEEKYLELFVKFWLLNEDIIYNFSKGNDECLRKYALMSSRKLGPGLTDKKFPNYYHELKCFLLSIKKYGIRFPCLTKGDGYFDTIEVRTMNGTFDYGLIQNYFNFFYHFLNHVTMGTLDVEKMDYYLQNYRIYLIRLTEKKRVSELVDKIYFDDVSKENFYNQYYGSR